MSWITKRGILCALALAACFITATTSVAVEGAGPYRGSGLVLPYFSNTSNVITFIRFVNAFDNDESPWNGAVVDQRQIWVHITYVTPTDDGEQCDELNSFFPMTRQDYYLLNVRNDANSPAPFNEGFAVAWAVVDDGGFPGAKIMHNQLLADEVTVDIANGRAWGVNSPAFRASTDPNCVPVCGDPDTWFSNNSNAEEFAVLGFYEGIHRYESLRFAENFFPTVMASAANISGARVQNGGTRYYIVPMSYADSEGRTVLVPGTLPPDEAYTNQYAFDVRLFDSDENRLSLPSQEVVCWDCLSALDLVGSAGTQFLNSTSGLERSQGWLEFNGRGFQFLPMHAPDAVLSYFNRALVAQVDALSLGADQVSWGFYPAHDRTTAEVNPDPSVFIPLRTEGPLGQMLSQRLPMAPPPTGACCVGMTCSVRNESSCDGMNGTWQGAGTDCNSNPCGGGTATGGTTTGGTTTGGTTTGGDNGGVDGGQTTGGQTNGGSTGNGLDPDATPVYGGAV